MPTAFETLKKNMIDTMEGILSKCENEKRDMTDAERNEFRLTEDALAQLEKDGNRAVRSPKLSFSSGGENEFTTHGIVGGLADPVKFFFRGRKPVSGRTMAQYIQDVVQGRTLVPDESRAMSLEVGTQGGFAAPETWARGFWSAVNNASVFLPRCRMYDFGGNNILHLIAWDSEDASAGPFGGVASQWKGEGETFTAVDPKIRAMTMRALKNGIFVDVTREASQNTGQLVAELSSQMVRAVTYSLDDSIMNGNGTSQPLGVLNSDSAVDVNRQVSNNVSYTDIVSMYQKLYPGFVQGAAWFASPDVIGELLTLQDPASSYIWLPAAEGVGPSRPGYLLGLPVFLTDKCPKLGTRGDLVLADLSAYAVGICQDVVLERTESARWFQDIYSFRAILRANGQALMDSPITPKNGGADLSWAVVLN